jgi:hypothetical protein
MSIVTLNDRAVRSVTTFGSLNTGNMVFIKKLTASSSSTLDFLNGSSDVVFDSTYKEYVFTFKDIHPSNDGVFLTFQADTGTNTNYNQTITSSYFTAYHFEDGSSTGLSYITSGDQAQGTSFQRVSQQIGNDNDQAASGILRIFNPADTTFVKHFLGTSASIANDDGPTNTFSAGYFNTTTALTRVQFKMSAGTIDAGDICLYGIN